MVVSVVIGSHMIGYLSRSHAREYRRRCRDAESPGFVVSRSTKTVSGWGRGRHDRVHFASASSY